MLCVEGVMLEQQSSSGHFRSFADIWRGGYYEGDPLDPLGPSKYRRIGYISLIHAVYQVCLRPYIQQDSVVLEIGPGRGAWTRGMLGAKEIWCLDAKSREDNKIDEYVGHPSNLVYHQVEDYECKMLPEDTFTFLFSFGCFCHVPFEGITAYAKNLFSKLKVGADAFWMVADYGKRNAIARDFKKYDVFARTLPPRVLKLLEFWNQRKQCKILGPDREEPLDKNNDTQGNAAGRWYHSGAARTADMLRECGYEIVTEDVGLVPRDAIVHFRKP